MMRAMVNPHIGLPRCLGLWAETEPRSEKPWPKSEGCPQVPDRLEADCPSCCSRKCKPDARAMARQGRLGSWRDELAVSKTGPQHLSERNSLAPSKASG